MALQQANPATALPPGFRFLQNNKGVSARPPLIKMLEISIFLQNEIKTKLKFRASTDFIVSEFFLPVP